MIFEKWVDYITAKAISLVTTSQLMTQNDMLKYDRMFILCVIYKIDSCFHQNLRQYVTKREEGDYVK
ncbi:hypothetical protein TTHERM_000061579 (macronuclear) [Tetrahymena thermophila SB210]|uniref:Uncharacterized protein n=1 Tax=Tetrahymena thermophila (strain SB210) TaxID=312017 RepID=W7XF95_TETTS|nr:hypothetical protein TTHERM_000061579 [Tetrahymena thermophila SB210]EWS76477.1 hypothetical protein TTHERM_000061579 [Tetrahymena thermophila SB210]|eukprot:XP_012650988.1 hypothetical protein TTHERM_000061579 [Tetrahymena thermophila SB210]